MRSNAATPAEYIASLPEERRVAVSAIRKVILKNLPKGFEEVMTGMLGYVVPHSLYPGGYHCDPKDPLPFIGLASQKNYIAFYHMGLYAGAHLDWFQEQWKLASPKKLDMGKCCVRIKKFDDMPLNLIGELCTKMTPQQWIDIYESRLKR